MSIGKWLTERDKEQEGFPVGTTKRSYHVKTSSTDIDGVMLTDEEFKRNSKVSGWSAKPSATPDLLTGNVITVPKLLRAMGNSAMGSDGRRVIFFDAATMIDQQAQIMVILEDVPGATALEKVTRLKAWYQERCTTFDITRRP